MATVFQFDEADTKIFQYSRGERDENGAFKPVYADPAAIKRQLEISLPNRSQLIDQYLAGENVKRIKRTEEFEAAKAHSEDPSVPEKIIEWSGDDMATVRMGGIAHEALCFGVRDAFKLVPFDETTGYGCTDYMVVAVLNHYQDWLEKKDGSTQPSATSSAPSTAA